MTKQKYSDVLPCDAPVEIIYKTLGIEMDAGPVKFSVPAQRHAFARHPDDFPIIIPHLSQILTSPLYLGDDFKNPGKIELVGRIWGVGGAALVSLTVAKNVRDGCYHVASTYLITQAELDKKLQKQVLKVARTS